MSWKDNRLALLLLLPMVVFHLGYLFNHSPEIEPTGFIQYDNVSYVAYGRQYLDTDTASLFYTNPFNDRAYPPVYFQPQSLFFAALMKLGVEPGWILIPFTLVCAFIGFRLMIRLYDGLQPGNRFRTLHVWLLCWGGGLLAMAGAIFYLAAGKQGPFFYDILELDPEHGWWGLNWGRALFFTCEAYYHAVFIGCILSLLIRKWALALGLLFLLALSHPFTGIEGIGIVGAFCFWELIVNRKELPWWFAIGVLAALATYLGYYFVFLERAPDHRSVREQYTLPWGMRWYRMIPAYALTGALAGISLVHEGVRRFFSKRSNRLFTSWFLVAFLLINHDLFMTARQPVHFTRGYVWTPLFLLGLPALSRLTHYWRERKRWMLYVLGLLFFLDNAVWIGNNTFSANGITNSGFTNAEQRSVLNYLKDHTTNRSLIISSNTNLAYLASVHTPAWPWYSHPFTTPFAQRKLEAQERFFYKGLFDPQWVGREVFFVIHATDSSSRRHLEPNGRLVFRNGEYVVIRVIP